MTNDVKPSEKHYGKASRETYRKKRVFPDVNRTIPFACGATLAYNYLDLQLRNDTDMTFKINLWLDDEYLHGTVECDRPLNKEYEIYETDHCVKLQWWGGYTRHNKIWRKITDTETGEIWDELVAENNAIMMYSPLLEGQSPKSTSGECSIEN
ncbi:MAG: VanW family protein [Paludibacteraceae bacterium]|nr:VanW family protein [Paludibacteraceae bacterium]